MRILVAIVLALASLAAIAKEATPTELDPVAERRAMVLAAELRCLVCQNQTIAESNADLAADLRREIRVQVDAGKTDAEILDFMTARYGDFVLYRPPLKATTVLLWFGPAALFVIGFAVLFRVLRARRARAAEDRPLADDERRRAEALLAAAGEKERT
ncbi:MAG: cytochrome c-type biogenesis protein CcmH [Burkholderiales bacterium]|nr:cytochrome c-type biogenesis protein CcmH [Burkholderiales bacterium]